MKVKNLTLEAVLLLLLVLTYFLNIALKAGLNIYVYMIFLYFVYLVRNVRYYSKLEPFFYFYLLYFIVLAFLGALNNNYSVYFYYDIIAFLCILFTLISLRFSKVSFYTTYWPQLGIYINIIAIAFSFYHVFAHGITVASITGGRGLENVKQGELMSPKYYLNVSFFLYPLVLYIKGKKTTIIYHLSILMFIFFSLAMGSRGTTIAGIIVFILTYLRYNAIDYTFKTIFSANFLKYMLFAGLGFILVYQITPVASAVDYLFDRFVSQDLGGARTEEAWEIYNNFTFNELLFGKGFGAANTFWIFNDVQNGVNNAHYGWMFLILKGGILLVIFIYLKIILSIIKLFRNNQLAPYSISLIGFLLLEYSHTNFNNFLNLGLMFIMLSASSVIKVRYNDN